MEIRNFISLSSKFKCEVEIIVVCLVNYLIEVSWRFELLCLSREKYVLLYKNSHNHTKCNLRIHVVSNFFQQQYQVYQKSM